MLAEKLIFNRALEMVRKSTAFSASRCILIAYLSYSLAQLLSASSQATIRKNVKSHTIRLSGCSSPFLMIQCKEASLFKRKTVTIFRTVKCSHPAL